MVKLSYPPEKCHPQTSFRTAGEIFHISRLFPLPSVEGTLCPLPHSSLTAPIRKEIGIRNVVCVLTLSL